MQQKIEKYEKPQNVIITPDNITRLFAFSYSAIICHIRTNYRHSCYKIVTFFTGSVIIIAANTITTRYV